jgi:hypothetical protein
VGTGNGSGIFSQPVWDNTRSMTWRTVRGLAALTLLVVALVGGPLSAHDIPNEVTIQAFVKPEGDRLRLLARVPLVSLRDMTWPFRAPDVLDVSRATSELTNAATLWLGDESTMYEGDRALASPDVVAIRATQPGDRSFESYEQALALVTGPPPPPTEEITIKEGFLDVLFEYPIQSAQSRFSLDPRWGRLGIRTLTVIRLILPDGRIRPFEVTGDPGLVRLDPSWYQAAWRFVKLGFEHILGGTDHLLFLLCLVIPFRRIGQLAMIVTAFTVAHSITLFASAYDLAPDALWFPPLIETLIAASIFYMALENIVGASIQRRWLLTFVFGLVHGVGFSFALKQTLQFAGSHLLTSLLAFNFGVEMGQLLVLVILIPALGLLFRYVVAERVGTIILSGIVAHKAWHWMTERGEVLAQYQLTWPEPTPAFFADVLRWLMAGVALAGLLWLVRVFATRKPDETAAQNAAENISDLRFKT